MKRLLSALALAALLAAPLRAATDDEVTARRTALDIAGAFTNDGFKLRDGNWCGTFAPAKPQLIQVNLYAGNQYWFTLGAAPAAKKVLVTVYDETGQPLASDPFSDTSVAAAGFSPQTSGTYFIKVEELEGTPAAFCLIYSYK
jgi:hypothetical protein